MKNVFLIPIYLLIAVTISFAQERRPLSIDDYFKLKDVSDVALSPDGKWVAYVVSNVDESKDTTLSNIYMVPSAGGNPIQITFSGEDESPLWSPDNKHLAFLSSRDKENQVYLLRRDGGEAVRLTDIEQGVDAFEWSPDANKLLLVLTDPDKDKKEDKAPPPYVITRLFFKFDGIGYIKDRS